MHSLVFKFTKQASDRQALTVTRALHGPVREAHVCTIRILKESKSLSNILPLMFNPDILN